MTGQPDQQGGGDLEDLQTYRNLRHAIEYDSAWPDGKPNYCPECDEALPEGDEMCGHNAALAQLVREARTPSAPTGDHGGLRAAVEALAEALNTTRDLDYDPSQEAWICGDHGAAECEQGSCPSLPWPPPNMYPTSDFALWADERFREAVAPYDRGEVAEMPEEAFHAYSMDQWPLGDALRALLAAHPLPEPAQDGEMGVADTDQQVQNRIEMWRREVLSLIQSPSAADLADPEAFLAALIADATEMGKRLASARGSSTT